MILLSKLFSPLVVIKLIGFLSGPIARLYYIGIGEKFVSAGGSARSCLLASGWAPLYNPNCLLVLTNLQLGVAQQELGRGVNLSGALYL